MELNKLRNVGDLRRKTFLPFREIFRIIDVILDFSDAKPEDDADDGRRSQSGQVWSGLGGVSFTHRSWTVTLRVSSDLNVTSCS